MSKWLEFVKLVREPGRKTDTYLVKNKVTMITIGGVFWYGGFRKYVFQTNPNIIMDAGCLKDVSDFLEALMEERKVGKLLQQ